MSFINIFKKFRKSKKSNSKTLKLLVVDEWDLECNGDVIAGLKIEPKKEVTKWPRKNRQKPKE